MCNSMGDASIEGAITSILKHYFEVETPNGISLINRHPKDVNIGNNINTLLVTVN